MLSDLDRRFSQRFKEDGLNLAPIHGLEFPCFLLFLCPNSMGFLWFSLTLDLRLQLHNSKFLLFALNLTWVCLSWFGALFSPLKLTFGRHTQIFSGKRSIHHMHLSLSIYIYIYMHSKFLCLPILSTYQPITNSISSGPPAIRGPGRKPHLRLQLPEGRRISTQCGRLLHVFIFLRAGDETVLWANTW